MLPDSRRYVADASNPLAARALANDSHTELVTRFRDLAVAGRDDRIRAALAGAPAALPYSRLWRALCVALEKPAGDEVSTRVFAIPWMVVCAGSSAATLSCVLPDPAAVTRVLEQHGVFGASRSVGSSSALCGLDLLESLAPGEVLRGWESTRIRQAAPAPIQVARASEEVHLRFLLGAAIVPQHAPDIVETGANIGAWGTPALRAMGAQLAVPGVQVLAIPRPPAGLYTAAFTGRRAAVETAFNLFMSNTLRRVRLAFGDPTVTLSAHEGGEVRVTLWTLLDDTIIEGFRWPLHPADDIEEIERSVVELISECRLQPPHVIARVLPDYGPTGAVLFPAIDR